MDIQFAKKLIAEHIYKINEEWILKAILKLIGINEKEVDSEFVKRYEANLKPMTREELIRRSEKSLQSYREGKCIDIEELLEEINSSDK